MFPTLLMRHHIRVISEGSCDTLKTGVMMLKIWWQEYIIF